MGLQEGYNHHNYSEYRAKFPRRDRSITQFQRGEDISLWFRLPRMPERKGAITVPVRPREVIQKAAGIYVVTLSIVDPSSSRSRLDVEGEFFDGVWNTVWENGFGFTENRVEFRDGFVTNDYPPAQPHRIFSTAKPRERDPVYL